MTAKRMRGKRPHSGYMLCQRPRQHCATTIAIEFFRWWIADERTGKRRLTRYAKTRAQAAEGFGDGAEPGVRTREVRDLPAPREDVPANSRPGMR